MDKEQYGDEQTIRLAEDILRLVAADLRGDNEEMTEVFKRYNVPELSENPEVQDLLTTSLSMNIYFVEAIALMTESTSEAVIDSLLLTLI